jgi:hypothetical protein
MVGLATGATSRRKIALVVASGIGMVLSLGSSIPTFRVALTVIPGLNLFRVPARWLLLPSIAIPLLAAIGLDGIRQGERPRWPLLGLLATTGIVGGAISVNRSGAFAPDRLALLCGGLAAGAVAVGWAVTLRRVSAGAMVAGAIVVLVVVELLAGDVGTDLHRLRMPAGSLTATSATAAALGDLHGGRVLSVGGGSLDDHPRQRASLRPNANVFDRLRSPDGYDGGLLYTPAWVGAMRRLLRNPSFDPLLTLRPQVTGPLDPHVFSELDVTRVVAADTSVDLDQVLPAGSHKTGTVGTITIYETPSGGPVFLADGAAPPGLRLDRRASHPEELAVDVPPGIGGRTVVISEAWAPGWHSPQTALHVYDGLLLSFVAPSRPGRIKLGYRQPGLLVGSLISALTFLLLVVIAVAAVRR